MATIHIEVRRLVPADAAAYREIRLEALRSEPAAFGSTFEAESAQTVEWFADRLGKSNMFGGFAGDEIVGMVGLLTSDQGKEAHKGLLVAMYVRRQARRSGVASRLVETILEFARDRVELVQLSVVSENLEALRLYERFGFVQFGLEKKALKQGDRYYDEIHMAKDLHGD